MSDASFPPPGAAPRVIVMVPTWRRTLAFLPELGVSSVMALFAGSVLGWLDWSRIPPDSRWNAFDQLIDVLNDQGAALVRVYAAALLALAGLGLIFDAAVGVSPFKRQAGMVFVDAFGRRPARWRLLVRALLRPLSVGALGLGALWSAFDRHRRAAHDILSGVYLASTPEVLGSKPPPRPSPRAPSSAPPPSGEALPPNSTGPVRWSD